MISGIARLRAKKGFTIIELIVVIAIIGVLTSIIVAAMSYDTKPTKGKGIAKDLYYVAQDVYSVTKIANPLAISMDDTGFFAEIDNTGRITSKGTIILSAGTPGDVNFSATMMTTVPELKHDRTAADDANCMYQRMFDAFETYLNTMDNMAGTVFVIADDHYRVKVAYWTDSPLMMSGNVTYQDNNLLANGNYSCAYPAHLSTAGKAMFVTT